MAEYTARKKVIERREWACPISPGFGVHPDEMSKMLLAAEQSYATAETYEGLASPLGGVWITSDGAEIVVYYEVERKIE